MLFLRCTRCRRASACGGSSARTPRPLRRSASRGITRSCWRPAMIMWSGEVWFVVLELESESWLPRRTLCLVVALLVRQSPKLLLRIRKMRNSIIFVTETTRKTIADMYGFVSSRSSGATITRVVMGRKFRFLYFFQRIRSTYYSVRQMR